MVPGIGNGPRDCVHRERVTGKEGKSTMDKGSMRRWMTPHSEHEAGTQ
jgi:hypothetical protein